MFKIERYDITNDFKVHNIITDENPNGDFVYDPFNRKEVLPFWGIMVTTFWGLNKANREYLIANLPKEELDEIQFKKFWLFWFSDGDINDQKELFFYGITAKENAYSVLNIFNHLLEAQIDKLIAQAKVEYKDGLNFSEIIK